MKHTIEIQIEDDWLILFVKTKTWERYVRLSPDEASQVANALQQGRMRVQEKQMKKYGGIYGNTGAN